MLAGGEYALIDIVPRPLRAIVRSMAALAHGTAVNGARHGIG
ncbi:hypothetical protein [Acidiferrobacter thiooxydans]|nr:hypothetical protein [Acidiferrobacter thiooxydans]